MRVTFTSGHVRGQFAGGTLKIGIERAGGASGRTVRDTIAFELPHGYRVHNDLVAAAMLTLVGSDATTVRFNFPISEHCATTLIRFYDRLTDVGPVDPSLAPRQPGRYLGLNLSGGLDSTAVWLLLREMLGTEFRTITTEYGGAFAFEAHGYATIPRDISCKTDFRRKGFDRSGRFNSCVTLLVADYLDLRAQVTGHPYSLNASMVESLRDGRAPRFLAHDLALLAGGLEEVHLIRSLSNLGPVLILAALAPERIPAAYAASAPPGSEKHFTKGMLLRLALERAGHDARRVLPELTPPRREIPWGETLSLDTRTLLIAKHAGWEVALTHCPGLRRVDRAAFDALSLRFLWRYNTNLIALAPTPMRPRLLAIFHRCGIEPFDAEDFEELDQLRGLLVASGVRYDPTTPPAAPLNPPQPAPVRPAGPRAR